jgi:hypothetical protein
MALRLAPAAEAATGQLPCGALLIVLGSALLPDERLKSHHVIGAMIALAGTVVLFVGRGGHHLRAGLPAGIRRGVRGGVHLGDLFGAVAPLRRGADRYGRGLLPRHRRARCRLPLLFEQTQWPKTAGHGSRSRASASDRWVLRSTPGISA